MGIYIDLLIVIHTKDVTNIEIYNFENKAEENIPVTESDSVAESGDCGIDETFFHI